MTAVKYWYKIYENISRMVAVFVYHMEIRLISIYVLQKDDEMEVLRLIVDFERMLRRTTHVDEPSDSTRIFPPTLRGCMDIIIL